MTACGFSETQFSFCYVFEILSKYPGKLVPLFPTTNQENKRGYDVNIGGSLFLQFKRPRYLKSENKYQIDIKNEKQFKLLYKLKSGKPANKVFYVAPIFHKLREMKRLYLSKEIEKSSALFPLEQFPPPSNAKYHKLKYEYSAQANKSFVVPITDQGFQPKGTYGVLNSDPISIETRHAVFSESDKRDVMTLDEKAKFLLNNVIPQEVARNFEIDNVVDRLFSILLVQYNILWLPIL
jgi:hypothetical protein